MTNYILTSNYFMKALCSAYVTFFLFFPHSVNELYVDDPDKDSGGKIEVSLNISLPHLHCDCEYIIYTTLYFLHCLSLCLLFLFSSFQLSQSNIK